jgi:hypothetical protein
VILDARIVLYWLCGHPEFDLFAERLDDLELAMDSNIYISVLVIMEHYLDSECKQFINIASGSLEAQRLV